MKRLSALAVVLMLWAQPASAALSFVQRTESTGASPAVIASKTYTAGNLIVLACHAQDGGNTPAITDSNLGNTWHTARTSINPAGSGNYLSIFYAYNVVGAAYSITGTWGSAYSFQVCTGTEWHDSAGAWSSDPLNNTQIGNGSSTAAATASITVSGGAGVIVFSGEADGQGWGAAGGYTVTQNADGYFADGYHIATASEAAQGSVASGIWEIAGASFNAAGGAPPPSSAPAPCMQRLLGVGCEMQ